jgi:hypothetical protein
MDVSAVELKFPFSFKDRLRAGLAVTAACWGCVLWTFAIPAVGIAIPIASLAVDGYVSTTNVLLSALLVAFIPFAIVTNAWRSHKAFADTPEHVYTINAEGVRSRSAHTEVTQDWSVIRSVRVRSGFLMLFFTKQCAHCIPLRWISDAQIGSVARFAREGKVQRVDV